MFHSYPLSYSHNFIKSPKLAKRLVALMRLQPEDLVVEIGPGRGQLTERLMQAAGKVIAVEKDEHLYRQLSVRTSAHCIHTDFLEYRLPRGRYKVIGNIPFTITADIIRKLLYANNPPVESYLIMQREAAWRLMGDENFFGLQFLPWFKAEIIWRFQRRDFTPVPGVDVVMVRISKRDPPQVAWQNRRRYLDELAYFFLYSRKADYRRAEGSYRKLLKQQHGLRKRHRSRS